MDALGVCAPASAVRRKCSRAAASLQARRRFPLIQRLKLFLSLWFEAQKGDEQSPLVYLSRMRHALCLCRVFQLPGILSFVRNTCALGRPWTGESLPDVIALFLSRIMTLTDIISLPITYLRKQGGGGGEGGVT